MHILAELFSKNSKPIDYPDKEIILHAEDTPSGVYFIESGYVKSVSISRLGDEKIHTIYKEGEIFPLAWVVSGVHEFVHYQALGKVSVRRVPRAYILEALHRDPLLMSAYTEMVVNLLSVYSNRIYTLEFSGARERVASRLLFFTERFGAVHPDGVEISVPITHRDLANTIGLSRETVTRVLRELEERQVISTEHKKIVVIQPETLRAFLI